MEHRIAEMEARSSLRHPVDAISLLIVVYLFWIFTTPIYSNRLEFLATNGFEKVLAGTLILLVLATGKYENLLDPITLLSLTLLGFMVVSDLMSSYPDNAEVYLWRESYWKRLVFLVILSMGLRQQEHIHQVLKGMILVIF